MRHLVFAALVFAAAAAVDQAADLQGFLGTWRGTSTCVDREAAPACTDETVVYEVRRTDKPGTVLLQADKIVDGKRLSMGELEFSWSDPEGCWRSEFTTPRAHGVWCLAVDGRTLTGTLRLVPGNAVVRKVRATRAE